MIKERKNAVLRCSEEYAFALREEYLGRTMEVLTEKSESGTATGHTTNFLPVLIPNKELQANQRVLVKLVKNTPDGLLGELVQ